PKSSARDQHEHPEPRAHQTRDLQLHDAQCSVIVPRGRWHRLELNAPSDLMSITLRHGTRLEKRTDTH
ncbi:hypothetical protein ACIGW9_40845, partial [Streptomyces sp. NPDC053813]